MDEIILNYKIEKILGEGGMSRVYLGIDNVTYQKVAIKELLPHLAQFEDIRERFRREAQVMAILNHPNIVRLIRYEELNNRLFLVQEYVDGVNLDLYINNHKGSIPENEAVKLLITILDAFTYAHSKGIIHRDIKPSNIIIENNQNIKILDFGIAKILDSGYTNLHTKTGIKIGTLIYMSPEQVKAEEISHLTDIYSLGVLLFQMLTGRAPYDSMKESEYEIQKKIVMDFLPRMKDIYPYVSDNMQIIVDKATSKKADNRYRSCKEYKKDLTNGINTVISSSYPSNYSKIDIPKLYFSKQHTQIIAGSILIFSLIIYIVFGISKNNSDLKNYPLKQNNYIDNKYHYKDVKDNNILDNTDIKASTDNDKNANILMRYRIEANKGNAIAQNKLGYILENGIGVIKNDEEAVMWYKKSAEKGYAKAQNNLGSMYDQGKGVKVDYAEAVKWYKKASAQGNAQAQNNLGSMYDKGTGVNKNVVEAVKWYLKGATQGNVSSQYNLGLKYQHGDGIRMDYKKAYYWFLKAQMQGHKKAAQHIHEIGY